MYGIVFRALVCSLVMAMAIGCGGLQRKDNTHSVSFIHATDPHLFLPEAYDAASQAVGEKRELMDQTAFEDLLREVPSVRAGDDRPTFLVLTGDLGVSPCFIADKLATDEAGGAANACLQGANAAKRQAQIVIAAKVLGSSPLPDIYLVAGNNDIAREDSGLEALRYFNEFIRGVRVELKKANSPVQLHNLTACYAPIDVEEPCFADVHDSSYRLIGFPSYSFKKADADADAENKGIRAKQFKVFDSLIDQARAAQKKVIVVTHTPELDDPFQLAKSRYSGEPLPGSIWKLDRRLMEDWRSIVETETVAGVLAGHLHDSNRETYRQPYAWSALEGHSAAFRKLFLAPPLSGKNQNASAIQARGFSLVYRSDGKLQNRLYWYDAVSRRFTPEPIRDPDGVTTWSSAIGWLWNLDSRDSELNRMAVLLIALLTAFLTIVALWQIPPPNVSDGRGRKGVDVVVDTSPFVTRFGKTVIAGLGGLVAAELTKTLGGEVPSPNGRWFFIVWFILFFFALLMSLNLLRALAEALRARIAIVSYPLARPGSNARTSWERFADLTGYWVLRLLHWLYSFRVPLLCFFDTFINLIQGKNQTMTAIFSNTIIDQQRNMIRVAEAIRGNLNEVIERRVIAAHYAGPVAQDAGEPEVPQANVRVNISVLSADQNSVFYVASAPGSSRVPFRKRSLAWVSVFTGEIRWYQAAYRSLSQYEKIILFENTSGAIAGESGPILLKTYYQPRDHEDYESFVIFPIPWPQRAYGSDYVKGGIQISFRKDLDMNAVWTTTSPNMEYATPDYMLERWCKDPAVSAALRNSILTLGELLRGFNEVIYKSYIEPGQPD